MTDDTTKKATPPPLLSGDDLYNALMAKIEPELMLDQIHTLQEKYKDENAKDRKTRAKRYEKAFLEYDHQYSAYQKQWAMTFSAYKKEALQSLEADEREDEKGVIKSIEEAWKKA